MPQAPNNLCTSLKSPMSEVMLNSHEACSGGISCPERVGEETLMYSVSRSESFCYSTFPLLIQKEQVVKPLTLTGRRKHSTFIQILCFEKFLLSFPDTDSGIVWPSRCSCVGRCDPHCTNVKGDRAFERWAGLRERSRDWPLPAVWPPVRRWDLSTCSVPGSTMPSAITQCLHV